MHLESLVTLLLVQQFLQANSKALQTLLVENHSVAPSKSGDAGKAAESVSVPWRHHEVSRSWTIKSFC